jgi:hypothetical protein
LSGAPDRANATLASTEIYAMNRIIVLAAAVVMFAGAVNAAPCRDSKGKFIKCPAAAAKHCRDTKSKKFVKCGTPGSEPVK